MHSSKRVTTRWTAHQYRYQRLAEETLTSVLREQMAVLDSIGFYSTDRRLEASASALKMLNKQLEPMHFEAQAVLVRAVRYRPDFEKQLQQIQLTSSRFTILRRQVRATRPTSPITKTASASST